MGGSFGLRLRGYILDLSMRVRGPRGERLRSAILWPVALVLVFVIAASVIGAYVAQRAELNEDLDVGAHAVTQLLDQELSHATDVMGTAIEAVLRDRDIETAFANRDRASLLRAARPLFEALASNQRISHFYFTLPDRLSLLRVHRPDLFGDRIDRLTTVRAARRQERVSGIESGPLGTLTLRVVQPWRVGARLIGYVEFGQNVDFLSAEIHRILGLDAVVLIDKRFLTRAQWEDQEPANPQPRSAWARFPKVVMADASPAPPPTALTELLANGVRLTPTPLRLSHGGRSLVALFLPLRDTANRALGGLVVLRDVTDIESRLMHSLGFIAGLSLLVGALVFGAFFIILGHVEEDYRRKYEVESKFERLSTEHQRIVQIEKLSAMGMMVGEIAHQINNPLVGVVNMAQLAEREAENPVRVRELLAEIRSAGRTCHEFVRHMLEFTRASSSERTATDLGELVHDTVNLVKQSIAAPPPLEIHLPAQQVILSVDPILLRHALFNLIINAIQASPEGGTIDVGLSAEPGPHDDAPGWCLRISDHGTGLSREALDKAFTPFFTTRPEGTGLGLAVSQQIVLVHDGDLSASNRTEGGACFAMWLPESTDRSLDAAGS